LRGYYDSSGCGELRVDSEDGNRAGRSERRPNSLRNEGKSSMRGRRREMEIIPTSRLAGIEELGC
jgi:hypothetical protein